MSENKQSDSDSVTPSPERVGSRMVKKQTCFDCRAYRMYGATPFCRLDYDTTSGKLCPKPKTYRALREFMSLRIRGKLDALYANTQGQPRREKE